MRINKIECGQCHGIGREQVWQGEVGSNIIKRVEVTCPQCNGKGYTTYPVFTVEEAVEISKYFGFKIEGLEDENND